MDVKKLYNLRLFISNLLLIVFLDFFWSAFPANLIVSLVPFIFCALPINVTKVWE
jgi:hypothetical protein